MECYSCTMQKLCCTREWPECSRCLAQQPAVQCKYPHAAYATDNPTLRKTKKRRIVKTIQIVKPDGSLGIILALCLLDEENTPVPFIHHFTPGVPKVIEDALQVGDFILEVNGRRTANIEELQGRRTANIEELQEIVREAVPGTTMDFRILRWYQYKRCRLRGCGSVEQPYYGLKNEDWRRCSAHKTSRMVRLDPQCARRHCQDLPEWAYRDDGGRVCKNHKLPLMHKKECLAAQCSGPREYGYFDGVPQFCKRHKLDSMCMGGARGWEEGRAALEKKDIILGKTRVQKRFMTEIFTGVVTALNRGFYTVTYEYGDTEEMNFNHLKQYVSSHTQNQVAEEQEDGEVELLFTKCSSEISVPNPQQIVVLSSNEGSASSSDEDSLDNEESPSQSDESDSTDVSEENRLLLLIKDKPMEGNSDLSKTTTKELAHALRFYRESYLSVKTDGKVEMGGGGKCPELGNAIKTVKKFKRKLDKWHKCTATIVGAESTVESKTKQPLKITKDQTKDKKDVISHLSAATLIDQGQKTQPKNNTQDTSQVLREQPKDASSKTGEVAKGDDAGEYSLENDGIQRKDTQTTSILDCFDDVPLSEFYDKAFELFEEQVERPDMDIAEVDSHSHLAGASISSKPEVGPNKKQKIGNNLTIFSTLECKTMTNDIVEHWI